MKLNYIIASSAHNLARQCNSLGKIQVINVVYANGSHILWYLEN